MGKGEQRMSGSDLQTQDENRVNQTGKKRRGEDEGGKTTDHGFCSAVGLKSLLRDEEMVFSCDLPSMRKEFECVCVWVSFFGVGEESRAGVRIGGVGGRKRRRNGEFCT